jgi:hypothetical protein
VAEGKRDRQGIVDASVDVEHDSRRIDQCREIN